MCDGHRSEYIKREIRGADKYMEKEILIVDDQPGIRMLLTDILANEGYQVSTAKNGKEALDKIYANKYNLIILDYKLPIIDGVEVLQKMKQNKVEIPTIIISGLVEEVSKESSNNNLIKKVIAKPFNVKDIQQSVKLILD